MRASGCERSHLGIFRNKVKILALVVVVTGTLLSSSVLFSSSGPLGASLGAGHGSGLTRADQGTPPTIYSFFASPSEILQGSSTFLIVSASSAYFNPLSYAYAGLPAGCFSSDTSFLFCAPTATGSFNITVFVTDTGTLTVARAYTTLSVDPVVTPTLFTLTDNPFQTAYVNFTEFGLPFGTNWEVTLGSDAQTASDSTLAFLEPDGTYSFAVAPVPGYDLSVTSGLVTVQGSPVPETVFFTPSPIYSVNFTESGLLNGTNWSVTLAGTTLFSNGTSILFDELSGSYQYGVGFLSGYTATSPFGSVFVFGPAQVPVSFAPSNASAYNLTFTETGLSPFTPWSVVLSQTVYGSSASSIVVAEPNGTANYTVGNVAGFVATPTNGSVLVSGASPPPVAITFGPAPTYSVTFQETGLLPGTGWSASVNGTMSSSTSSTISTALANGSYVYNIGGSSLTSVPGYVVAPQSGQITVAGTPITVNLTYGSTLDLGAPTAPCTSINSPPFYQNFCHPEAQMPTLLSLANGSVGLVSQVYTQSTENLCPGAATATIARVGFGLSTTDAASFSGTRSLGNDSCAYLDAIEPSFSVSGSNIYGAFVEENSTAFPQDYISRATDALGFLVSTDNGSSFGPALTVNAGGNIARPSVASFGSTVYIVYENIANSSTPIPGGYLPIALELLYSTDSGATWHGPVTVPGLGASEQYTSMSPAVTVNDSGAVSVVYATDRSCLATGSGGSCLAYGDSIVVSTSTTNGTTWQGPTVLAPGAGETLCYTGACYSGFFESTPQVTAAYAPGGGPLYVAYSATYDQGPSSGSANFNHTGVFALEDSAGVVSGGSVVAPTGATALRSFNPGLAVSFTGVYLTYLQANESPGRFALANSLSQWVATSPIGSSLAWSLPIAVDIQSFVSGGSVNATRSSFPGYSSSVTFDSSGNPLIAFALPEPPTTSTARGSSYYYVNTTYPTALVVGALALPGSPNTVSMTFTEMGLPSGKPWQFAFDGVVYALTSPSIQITNVPLGLAELVGATYQPGFWEVVSNEFNATITSFSGNTTSDIFSFEVWEGLEFSTLPSGLLPWLAICCDNFNTISTNLLSSPFGAYASGTWEQYNFFSPPTYSTVSYSGYSYSSSFSVNWYNSCANVVCGYTTPWYFPLGATLTLQVTELSYGSWSPTYFTGSGAGSYTGQLQGICFDSYDCPVASGTITMLGPINETLWWDNGPTNLATNVTFTATGLPSTSQYFVTLDSSNLSGNNSAPAVATEVAPGAHSVANVWATSSQAGWEYFGSVVGPNPIVTPVDSGVTLAFASLVNLSAPAGVVTFHATNLTAGTDWSITFNNTVYSASGPWINITTRPGTFQLSADRAVSPSGTTGYLPTVASESLSVVTGDTYTLTYVPAYEVRLVASTGGFVSAQGGSLQSQVTVWEAAGSAVTLAASPTSGYVFVGWNGTGPGAYSGPSPGPTVHISGPVVETASFLPLPGARFNLTFAAAGLPPGAWWTVVVNGTGHSTNASAMTIGHLWPWSLTGTTGHYTLSVPKVYLNSTDLTRFVPLPLSSQVGTNGSSTPPFIVSYSTQFFIQLTATAGGDAAATYQNQPLGTTDWLDSGTLITITAVANAGYIFDGWQGTGIGSYTGSNPVEQVTVGDAIREVALFSLVVQPPPSTYTLVIDLTTQVESGTVWGVTFGGVGYTSTGSSLTISGLSGGAYTMLVTTVTSPDGSVQYRPTPTDPVAYTVARNGSLDVALAPYYWVDISASTGGEVTPSSGYFAANSILYLTAAPNTGYSFAQWSGSGPGAYAGTNSTAAVIVTAPLTEVAEFHASGGGTTGTSIWSSPETWAGLGALGLVVGLFIGFVFVRGTSSRNTPPPSRPSPSPPGMGPDGGDR